MKKQVAILGGTFDPIHNGHLKLAENAFRQFRLDEIWFMPAPNPPHKTGREIVDFQDRAGGCRRVGYAADGKGRHHRDQRGCRR